MVIGYPIENFSASCKNSQVAATALKQTRHPWTVWSSFFDKSTKTVFSRFKQEPKRPYCLLANLGFLC